jgi:predicted ATPase/DNA-binding XRE family transcriptional regulator
MNGNNVSFGQWLKERRRAQHWSREELAERVGCSPSAVEKIELGQRRPSRQITELLAEQLQIPQDEWRAFTQFARSEPEGGVTPAGEGGSDGSPWRAKHRRQTNLPAPLTPLIAREAEIAAVDGLLARDRLRLLTLTGPPGIGKTRLAIEAASESLPRFDQGVYFVPLAPLGDAGLVLPTIARMLGVTETAGRSLTENLKEHLRDKRALLVLDNFEHLLAAAPAVAEILVHCPWLKVLVTSQQPLRVRGERQFPVPALDVPDVGDSRGTNALLDCSSVALFVDRAREANPDFALTDERVRAIAGLCARVEGLPLAIELLAARSDLITPEALLAQSGDLLGVESDLQDMPARHRTLREAITWSYHLLDEGQRVLFARLGVFAGGFTPRDADAVCNSRGDLPMLVRKGLGWLSDKSLLAVQQGGDADGSATGEARYTMLETIRHFALERLEEAGEADNIRRLHMEYYLALVSAAELEFNGPKQPEFMELLEKEHNNLRGALAWALESQHHERALHLSGTLGQFWNARGYLTEGRRWLEAALRNDTGRLSRARAKALLETGTLAVRQGDYEVASGYYQESLAIYRTVDDRHGIALALSKLGAVAHDRLDFESADRFYQESLTIFRETGDRVRIAGILNNLGNQELLRGNIEQAWALYNESLQMARELGSAQHAGTALLNLGRLALYHRGDYEGATTFLTESLGLSRALGSRGAVAATLYQLSRVMLNQGRYSEARDLLEEALDLCEELGERLGSASTLLSLGLAILMQGGRQEARRLITQSLTMFQELGNKLGTLESLEAIAGVSIEEGEAARAARLLGAAESQREAARDVQSGIAWISSWLERARKQLDSASFCASWEEGRAMSLEQAIEYALDGTNRE